MARINGKEDIPAMEITAVRFSKMAGEQVGKMVVEGVITEEEGGDGDDDEGSSRGRMDIVPPTLWPARMYFCLCRQPRRALPGESSSLPCAADCWDDAEAVAAADEDGSQQSQSRAVRTSVYMVGHF